jgi:hypothetical protein
MLASRDIDIVLRNNLSASFNAGSFVITIFNSDASRLFAPSVEGGEKDGNPDAAPSLLPASDWGCGPFGPDNDQAIDGDPNTQQSFLVCQNGSGTGPVIAPGGTLKVATVHYNLPAGADPGTVELWDEYSDVQDGVFYEDYGRCNPGLVTMDCPKTLVTLYCPIDQADINNDGKVNSGDQLIIALNYGVVPAPLNVDQNFDGVLNSGDQLMLQSVFNKSTTLCP